MFANVTPGADEIGAQRSGDGLVPNADVVMDRAFSVDAAPDTAWPWLVQLGKQRAGWYFPRRVEYAIPRKRRAIRRIDDRWQHLEVGDVIPDYGGRNETFEVAIVDAPQVLVYISRRGQTDVSWSITLTPTAAGTTTRIHLRLRLGPVRHRRLAEIGGGAIDLLTIAGMAAGLRERLREGVDR